MPTKFSCYMVLHGSGLRYGTTNQHHSGMNNVGLTWEHNQLELAHTHPSTCTYFECTLVNQMFTTLMLLFLCKRTVARNTKHRDGCSLLVHPYYHSVKVHLNDHLPSSLVRRHKTLKKLSNWIECAEMMENTMQLYSSPHISPMIAGGWFAGSGSDTIDFLSVHVIMEHLPFTPFGIQQCSMLEWYKPQHGKLLSYRIYVICHNVTKKLLRSWFICKVSYPLRVLIIISWAPLWLKSAIKLIHITNQSRLYRYISVH